MDFWSSLAFVINMDQMCPHCEEDLTYSDPDEVECSYGKVYQNMRETDCLPSILPEEKKSNKMSETLRQKGNKAYGAKDNKAAITLFTKAVGAALPDGKELALAYANRSAVFYDLQEFKNCIRDIDHALSNGIYPDNLKYKLHERRGKCFLAKSQFSKALADFKLAENLVQNSGLAEEKVDALITQIDSLIESCNDRPDLPEKSFTNPIKLSDKPSPYIQSASSAVDIKHSSKMGREIVANTNIKPGDVLAIEKYYASALVPECFLDHCDKCMKTCLSPIPCTSCQIVSYCSEDCRRSSWTAYHSMECSILPSLHSYFATKTSLQPEGVMKMHLALRILLVASKCGRDIGQLLKKEPYVSDPSKVGFVNGKYLSNNYASIRHLATNIEATSDEFMAVFAAQGTALMHFLRKCSKFFQHLDTSAIPNRDSFSKRMECGLKLLHLTVSYLLTKIVMMLNINCVEVEDAGSAFGRIGGAVYPFYSLFNHSCDPEVTYLPYTSDSMFVIATQPIRKGQQACTNIGFGYKDHPLPVRQKNLKILQHFICRCPPCVENWPLRSSWPVVPLFKRPAAKDKILQHVETLENIRKAVMQGEGTEEHLKFLIDFMTLIHNSVKLPWEPYTKCQEVITLYMASQAYPDLLTNSPIGRQRAPEVPEFLIPQPQPIRIHMQI